MHALKRFGTAFGGYKMMENYPVPVCGPDDIIIEIKAAAICGADMKHWQVDNGYDDTNITPDQQQSVRGHEFAGEIVEVGENVKDWHVGQRVVSDNSAHVCGVCPACESGDFLCCENKVNLGLDNNIWGGGFSKYCKVPGEILAIHKHAIWEIPEGVKYEEAAVLDPICNSYKAIAQQSHLIPGQDVVVFGTGPLGLFAVQVAKLMGAVNIVMVGLEEDVKIRFPVAMELGATHCVNGSREDVVARCTEICGRDNLGLVIECSGANIALKQAIEMTRPNAEIVRVGMGFKPLEFSINDITAWNKSIIGHMAYDSTSWRNCIRLLKAGMIKVEPMITHRLGLSQWKEGFDAMAKKEATSTSQFMTMFGLFGAPFGIFIASLIMDKLPRRVMGVLLLTLMAGLGIATGVLAPSIGMTGLIVMTFLLNTVIYMYVCYASAVYVPEMWPTSAKLSGSGFSNAMGRVSNIFFPFLVTWAAASIGPGSVFILIGIVAVIIAVSIIFLGVETRGESVEDIGNID